MSFSPRLAKIVSILAMLALSLALSFAMALALTAALLGGEREFMYLQF